MQTFITPSGLKPLGQGLLSAAAFVLALASSAGAADLGGKTYIPPTGEAEEVYMPPSSLPQIWQGLYLGGSVGYGWGGSELDYDRNANHGLSSVDPEGFLGSLTVGYNFVPAYGFLIGAEADLGVWDISADDRIVYDGHVTKTQYGPWWGTIRARAGVILGQALLYATGGVAFTEMDELAIGNTPGETAFNEELRSGWTVGGGIEYALMPGVTGKIEYLHMDFGEYDGLSANQEAYTYKNEVDLVRTGINIKF